MIHTLVRTSFVIMILALVAGRAAADTFEGKVVVVTAAKLTIVTKTGENRDFTATEKTKITLDGKPAKLNEIEAGAQVKITADKATEQFVATEIEAHSAE